jgi:hypothetical protein
MLPLLAGAAMGAGGGSSSQSDSTSFLGGSTGGINFGGYKSTDQNTILLVAAVAIIALFVLGKK